MSRLIDECQIASGFLPIDMQSAANNGDYVSMKNYRRLAVILFKGIGTDGDDPVVSFFQATTVAGGGEKGLTKCTGYHMKQGADLKTVGTFTEVTQAAAAICTLNAMSAESAGIYVFSISDSDLDVANGFDCVKVSVADVGGNAQLGAMLYVLGEPRHAAAILPSAIID